MGRIKLKPTHSRRDFMKQVGVAAGLAVPFLNSPVAMGQTATAPVRVLIVPLQHGWGFAADVAAVSGTETNFTFPRPLQALNGIKDQCTIVDALRTSYWGNAHDVSYSDILTCSVAPDAPEASALGGPFFVPRTPSIDWMIGNQHSKSVLRLSHHYSSFGAAFHPLSFDSSLRSLPFYTNARDAYMGVIDPLKQMTTPPVDTTIATNDALFKLLGNSTQRLLSRMSGAPRAKMQSYLTGLNALGNRILTPAGGRTPANVVLPNLPGMNLAFNDQMDQYLDMIRIAFTLDTHRVAVLGLGEGATGWTWTNSAGQTQVGNTLGSDFHHDVAHYDHGPNFTPAVNNTAAYHGWVHWYAQKIAGFVNTLKQTIDVDGRPMIDNTIIVLTGEVGNGLHDRSNFTHVVIGGGGAGRIRRNRWLRLAKFEPRDRGDVVWGARRMNGSLEICDVNYGAPVSRHHLADLWVSIARLSGVNINTFGSDVYNFQPIQLT